MVEEINEKRPRKSGASENSTSSVDLVIKDERIASEHARLILLITLGNKIYRCSSLLSFRIPSAGNYEVDKNEDAFRIQIENFLRRLIHLFDNQKG